MIVKALGISERLEVRGLLSEVSSLLHFHVDSGYRILSVMLA